MTRLVDLDALVPEDVDFKYRGESYVMPGDISVAQTFKLVRLYERAVAVDADPDIDVREKAELDMEQALLELFRERDPDLAALPFGTLAYRHVLAEVLSALGLQIVPVDPPTPPPNRATRRAAQKKSSPRSAGSRK